MNRLRRWWKTRSDNREAKRKGEALLTVLQQIDGQDDDWQIVVPFMSQLMSGREPNQITEQLTRLFRHITAKNSNEERHILANCVRQAGNRMKPKARR